MGATLMVFALAVLIGAYVLHRPTPDRSIEATDLLTAFGAELKDVALLGSPETVSASLAQEYGAYLAPELLAAWQADPSLAPGRLTSSPWPDRIDVVSVTQVLEDRAYQAEVNVIEVAHGVSGEEEVSRYPASVRIEERAGKLLIAEFQKGEYTNLPARMVVEGEYICLPHRNQEGPQTLECAFGLQGDDGSYYALSFMLLSSTDWTSLSSGSRIRVEGPYAPDDGTSRYPIVGTISVTSLELLDQ